jgi:uncharacterized BrkB/YihY/UPF0761 family membrane protein
VNASPGGNLPPIPKLVDYPIAIGIVLGVLATASLVVVAGRFDPTGGTLTISILVVLAMVSTTIFVMLFSIPTDEITSAVLGGLVAAFGAVMAFWLGKRNGP